jgi:hypothetical protein
MSAGIVAADRFEADGFVAAPGRQGGWFADLLVLLIPASAFVQFHVVGVLFAPDVLLLVLFPFVLAADADRLRHRLPRILLVLGAAWLAAQVATDLIRSTPFYDYARGWAKIANTLTNFTVIYTLVYHDFRRVAFYTFGLASGGILTYLFNPNLYAAGDPWKFGYGYGVILLVVLGAALLDDRGRHGFAILIMAAAAAVNLYNGFRSLAGECFLTATYLIVQRFARARQRSGSQVSLAGACVTYAILALASVGLLLIYRYGATSGMFGYTQWRKYEIESSGSYGVLVGGRIDFLVGLQAVADSPLVGHGSWAKDWRYQSRPDTLMAELGYRTSGGADSWVIPAHSHLVGAWVEAGIVGAAFWVWVFSLPWRVLARLYRSAEPLSPLVAFLALVLIWDIILSPYGADRLFATPFYVAVMMFSLERRTMLVAEQASGRSVGC